MRDPSYLSLLPSAWWLAINSDASAPQARFAIRIKVALPSAIFID
jgi:hypothetical protein